MSEFLRRGMHWVLYRLRLRLPRTMARLSRELPLRSVSALYTPSPSSGLQPARIPRVVHQTWLTPRLGRSHAKALSAFRSRNPDFSFQFFDDVAIERYMEDHFGNHPVHEVFRNAVYGPMRTDIWRYCLLFERGGVYCDIGKAINIPLRELTSHSSAVISWEERNPEPFRPSSVVSDRLEHPDRRVINWALMFEPRHPLLESVIDGIVDKYPRFRARPFTDPKQAILELTGPIHLTECVHAFAETSALEGIRQAGINFEGAGQWELPGSYVRYLESPPYILAKDQVIVR